MLLTRRGSLMLMVLVFMIALSGLATAFLFSVNSAGKVTAGQVDNLKAFYLAEAGLEKAKWYLLHTAPDGSTDASWRTSAYPTVAGANPTDPQAETLDGGIYTIWVRDYSVDASIYLTSSATVNGVERTVYQRVKTGPVGQWGFNGGIGMAVTDSSGYGNNGTWSGTATYVAGKKGQAGRFNGSSHVSVPDAASLNMATLTVALWTKVNVPTSPPYLVGKSEDYTGYGIYEYNWGPTGKDIAAMTGQCWGGGAGRYSPVLGQWHFYAMSVNRAGAMRFYVDQNLIGEKADCDFTDAVSDLVIGKHYSMDEFFNGDIDDVRVYSRALSAEELAQLYMDGDLVGHWEFDEGSGTTVADSSGNGNTGTVSSALAWTSGKVGDYALNLDGTKNATAPIDIDDYPEITLAAWVYKTAYGGTVFGNDDGGFDRALSARVGSPYYWFIYTGAGWEETTTPSALNTWTHVALVYSGSDILFYVNGEMVYNTGYSASDYDSEAPFQIGRSSYDGGSDYFTGKIDDVRLYSRTLSATEIARLYAGETTESVNRRLSIVPGSWGEK